jgi:tRNA1Val (adenine37-N6)-methyltransferase
LSICFWNKSYFDKKRFFVFVIFANVIQIYKMFHFKHFSLFHENSALKISTDAVLLAAVTPVNGAQNLLDIGCGCGVIAFCLAWKMQQEKRQKKNTQKITGLDIDAPSISEALKNAELFPKSPKQHFYFLQQSIQDYILQEHEKFDLIVSNPPFFVDSLKPNTLRKNISKHNDTLPFEELRNAVCHLLSDSGYFYLILPASESEIFEQISQNYLFKNYQLLIQPTPSKPVNRIITGYQLTPSDHGYIIENLCLRNIDGSMSEEYRKLTGMFLLK